MRSRGLGALFGTALFQGRPLRDLVDQFVSDELIDAIAREAMGGRLLLVATTNLDREEAVIWNMGAIAALGSPSGRQLFKDVLVASASVPGVFPPVMLEVQAGQVLRDMQNAPLGDIENAPLSPLGGNQWSKTKQFSCGRGSIIRGDKQCARPTRSKRCSPSSARAGASRKSPGSSALAPRRCGGC
jgi:predicted acylesterase/phospholipase RssA